MTILGFFGGTKMLGYWSGRLERRSACLLLTFRFSQSPNVFSPKIYCHFFQWAPEMKEKFNWQKKLFRERNVFSVHYKLKHSFVPGLLCAVRPSLSLSVRVFLAKIEKSVDYRERDWWWFVVPKWQKCLSPFERLPGSFFCFSVSVCGCPLRYSLQSRRKVRVF